MMTVIYPERSCDLFLSGCSGHETRMSDKHCGGYTPDIDLEFCEYVITIFVKMAKIVHGLPHCFMYFCADNQREFFAPAGDHLWIHWPTVTSHQSRNVRFLQLYDME